MIAYRAESSMASLLREYLARGCDDARALLRQIFRTEADLTPDPGFAHATPTVSLHHLTQASHDQAIVKTARRSLTPPKTVFPGFHKAHPSSSNSAQFDFIQIRRSDRKSHLRPEACGI